MIYKSKIIFLSFVFGLMILLLACEDKSQLKKQAKSHTVSGTISQPVTNNKLKKDAVKKSVKTKKEIKAEEKIKTAEIKIKGQLSEQKPEIKLDKELGAHYDSQGKIDPFAPLIQDTPPDFTPVAAKQPERILTPLEKIELSQIRLVAVIIMKNRRIAMVEEASGKGYEVGIGTYIGKNQGKVFEIRKSSIVVKELVMDYKGRLKERVQEIKLYKADGEG